MNSFAFWIIDIWLVFYCDNNDKLWHGRRHDEITMLDLTIGIVDHDNIPKLLIIFRCGTVNELSHLGHVAQPGQSEGFVNLRSWVQIPP